jgi:hypothetical protein
MPRCIGNNGNVRDQIRSKDERANERHFVCFMIMLARLLP